jgi:hypothetical protein
VFPTSLETKDYARRTAPLRKKTGCSIVTDWESYCGREEARPVMGRAVCSIAEEDEIDERERLAGAAQNSSRCWPPIAPPAAATKAPIKSVNAMKNDA